MKLLIATDGSENALNAVRFAADFLGKCSEPGSITLVSVNDTAALHFARRSVGQNAADDYLQAQSEHDFADARALLDGAGIQYETLIRNGHVASEIVAAADEGKFDMIVLGSKGRGTFTDLLVGSVATRVSEMAKIPVLLVR